MRQTIGFIAVIVGVCLLVMGMTEGDSLASSVSRFFTGNPTDRAIWLGASGIFAILIGLACTMLPPRLLVRR